MNWHDQILMHASHDIVTERWQNLSHYSEQQKFSEALQELQDLERSLKQIAMPGNVQVILDGTIQYIRHLQNAIDSLRPHAWLWHSLYGQPVSKAALKDKLDVLELQLKALKLL